MSYFNLEILTFRPGVGLKTFLGWAVIQGFKTTLVNIFTILDAKHNFGET